MQSENEPGAQGYGKEIQWESESKDQHIATRAKEVLKSMGSNIHLPENVMIPLKQSILVSNQVTIFRWNSIPFLLLDEQYR